VDATVTPAATGTVLNFATDNISAGTTFQINNIGVDSAINAATLTKLANNQVVQTDAAFKTVTLDTAGTTSSITVDLKAVGTSGTNVIVDLDTAASLNNTITAAGYVNVDTLASGAVKVTAVKNITVDATEAVSVNLTSTEGDVSVTNADEAVVLKVVAAGAVTVANVDLVETIDITAGKTISLTGNIAATSATLSAKGTSTITDDANTLKEVTLSGNGGAATYDMDAGADILEAATIIGAQDVTLIVSATSIDALTGDVFKLTDSSTGVSTLELTGAGNVDVSTSSVDSVKLSANLSTAAQKTLTVASGQAVKVKVDQTDMVLDGVTSTGSSNTATITLDDGARDTNAADLTALTVTDIKTLVIDASVDTTSTGTGQTYVLGTLTATDENSSITINQGVNKLSSTTMLNVGTGSVTITGSGTVSVAGVTGTTFDASAVTGIVTFTSIDGDEIANVKTGTAADVLTIDDEGAKSMVIESGAGNDSLTIDGALDWYTAATNFTIDMGEGTSDTLVLGTTAVNLRQATGKVVTISNVEAVDFQGDVTISASTITGKSWLLEETGDNSTATITVSVASSDTAVDLGKLGYQTGKAGTIDDETFVVDASANTVDMTIIGAVVSKNTLKGGSGVNTITGGDYDDAITAGNIKDVLDGGDGADTFDLDALEGGTASSYVTIKNFEANDGAGDPVDVIDINVGGAAAIATTAELGGLWTVSNGIATKSGATVASFIAAAAEFLNAGAGDEYVVAFVAGGSTWLYSSGESDLTSADDIVVKLDGVVLTGLEAAASTAGYLVIA